MPTLTTGRGLTGALLLTLAACGGAEPEGGNNATSAAATPASTPAPAPPPAAPPAPLVLEGHGLRLAGGGASEMLPFDSPKAATIAAIAKALGKPPTEQGANEECGGGILEFAAWEGDLTAWFEGERFVGWDNKGALRTADGIGIGSPRAELATLPGFEVEQSSLGAEFRTGGLSGLLDSRAPGARVTALWGGATCVFR